MRITHKAVRASDRRLDLGRLHTISDKIFAVAQNTLHRCRESDMAPHNFLIQSRLHNAIRTMLEEHCQVFGAVVMAECYADGWEVTVDLGRNTLAVIEESINEQRRHEEDQDQSHPETEEAS